MGRDRESLRGLDRGRSPEHQLGHLLLARGETVGLEQERRDECWVSALNEDSDLSRARGTEESAVEDEPRACRRLHCRARKRQRARGARGDDRGSRRARDGVDRSRADGAREECRGVGEQLDVAGRELGLAGSADEDQRPPGGSVGDERAAELGTEPSRCQQVAKALASLRVATRRLVHRCRLALGACELVELVHILGRVLVVRQDGEAVGQVLEAVLGNEVRSRVERVPARTVERDRSLQSRRGLVDPMMYLADDREPNRLYVFASAAGADTNPAWFHNLIAHPEEVRVEVGSDTMTATAEVLPDARRGEVYAVQASRYPGFANYQAKTTRLIPVIALTLHR